MTPEGSKPTEDIRAALKAWDPLGGIAVSADVEQSVASDGLKIHRVGVTKVAGFQGQVFWSLRGCGQRGLDHLGDALLLRAELVELNKRWEALRHGERQPMRGKIAGLKQRVRKLEKQYGAESADTAASVQDRIQKAVLASLSDAELDTLEEYLEQPDGHAEPDAEQKAVLDLCERRYRDFQTAGKIVVNG